MPNPYTRKTLSLTDMLKPCPLPAELTRCDGWQCTTLNLDSETAIKTARDHNFKAMVEDAKDG